MEYYAYLAVLMSLPPLAQWRWGWRGAAIATAAALLLVAAIYYGISVLGQTEPAPPDMNPEARAQREVFGAFALLLILALQPAAAVLAGVALAAAIGLARFARRAWKAGRPPARRSGR